MNDTLTLSLSSGGAESKALKYQVKKQDDHERNTQ